MNTMMMSTDRNNHQQDEAAVTATIAEDPMYFAGDIDEAARGCGPPPSSCVTDVPNTHVINNSNDRPESEFEEYSVNILVPTTDEGAAAAAAAASRANTPISKHLPSQITEKYPTNATNKADLRRRIAHYYVCFVIVSIVILTGIILGFTLAFGRDGQEPVKIMDATPSSPNTPSTASSPETDYPKPLVFFGGPFQNDAELRESVALFLSGNGQGRPISDWNVSGISNFSNLFAHVTYFNEDLSAWDMSLATTTMGMFMNASFFNQPLNTWSTANIQDMSYMFAYAAGFDQDISNWDVSNVQTMESMFLFASSFCQNLSPWRTPSLTNMFGMFSDAATFNGDLTFFDVSKVTSMFQTFSCAFSFNQDLSTWDTSNTTNMAWMFFQSGFNQDISMWDVSKVQDFSYMFDYTFRFNRNLCPWGSKVQSSAAVSTMFGQTSCEFAEDPNLSVDPPGPFCYAC